MEKPKDENHTQPQTTKPKDSEKLQHETTNTRELETEKQPMKLATSSNIPKELEKPGELEATPEPKESSVLEINKEKNNTQPKPTTTRSRLVWDCESSLYDSFELKSFEKQLDSAIISSSRTLSMNHLSDHHRKTTPPPLPSATSHHHRDETPMSTKKPNSKLSRSIHKFLRSVFRPKQNKNNTITGNNNSSSSWFRVEKGSREGVYYVYDTSGALSTIPEGPETVGDFDGLSPDLKSFVRRTASDRFAPTSLGISCA